MATQIGTSDRMQAIPLDGKLQLEFVDGDNASSVLVLTKLPMNLFRAIRAALNANEDVTVEFAGENYTGRVCFFSDQKELPFTLTFEFVSLKPVGYLLHMSREDLVGFVVKISALPASPHPTD